METDASGFVTYFGAGMAEAFTAVQVMQAAKRGAQDYRSLLRQLDPRQWHLLHLFRRQGTATGGEIAHIWAPDLHTVITLCRGGSSGLWCYMIRAARTVRTD